MSRKPGDWDCPDCGTMCFASKRNCWQCGCPKEKYDALQKGGSGSSGKKGEKGDKGGSKSNVGIGLLYDSYSKGPSMSASSFEKGGKMQGFGDWDCPECGELCFGSKEKCRKCGCPRGDTPDSFRSQKGYSGKGGSGSSSDQYGGKKGPISSSADSYGGKKGSSYSSDNYNSMSKGSGGGKPGDWDCLGCGTMNFASREKCFSCGKPRGDAKGRGKSDGKDGYESKGYNDKGYKKGGGKSGGGKMSKPGDWVCEKCGDMQFASRELCRTCGAPKPKGDRGGRSRSRSASRGRERSVSRSD